MYGGVHEERVQCESLDLHGRQGIAWEGGCAAKSSLVSRLHNAHIVQNPGGALAVVHYGMCTTNIIYTRRTL